ADPLTHIIVFFAKNNNDKAKTIVYLFHTGWRNNNDWQEARNYFENAWSKALKELKKKVKNKTIQ
ncbi:MAG: hypothetical protein ACFFE5_14050, partial [Candidatus Thorarchaeota archaeon]